LTGFRHQPRVVSLGTNMSFFSFKGPVSMGPQAAPNPGPASRAPVALSPLVLAAVVAAAACGSTGQDTSQAAGTSGGAILTGAGGSGGQLGTAGAAGATNGDGGSSGEGGSSVGSGPPYPFVLAHGFFGFTTFAGLDFETYFYQVKDHLAAQGEVVDTPAVDPFNDSDYRGAELLVAVQQFLAETGAAKVNIIGHSQGGLDARVVANLRPDLVASVVTLSTPHHGSPVGDVAMKLIDATDSQSVIDALTQLIGGPLYDTIGNATSLTKALYLFSQPGITAFNKAHPNSPGVFYASIAGRSELRGNDDDCTPTVAQPFISSWSSTVDPLNPLFDAFVPVLIGDQFYVNDGLVRAKDAQWGEFWGCLPADHIDEIGQILGENPGPGNDWKYLDLYTEVIAYMRSRGY
jgi:triacylglycerol lipase